MSWIQERKQAKGSVWVACYVDADGKKIRKSTGIPVQGKAGMTARAAKSLAEQTAARMEAAAKGDTTLERLHDALDVAAIEAGLKTGKTIRALLTGYTYGGKEQYLQQSAKAVQRFIDSLGAAADLRADKLSIEQCQAYADERLKTCSTRTVKKDIQFLSTPYREAVLDGMLPRNPFVRVKVQAPYRVEADSLDREPLTDEDVKIILTKFPTDYADLARVSLYTFGQRLSDCKNLRWDMFDDDLTTLRLTTGKTGRFMTIPVCPVFKAMLQRRKGNGSEYVIPVLAAHRRSSVSGTFSDLMKLHGIIKASDVVKLPGQSVSRKTFHSIRHTVVSKLRAAFMPGLVLEAVGQTEEVQRHYMHTSAAQQLTMLETLAKATA